MRLILLTQEGHFRGAPAYEKRTFFFKLFFTIDFIKLM